jgi:hypothetical protein
MKCAQPHRHLYHTGDDSSEIWYPTHRVGENSQQEYGGPLESIHTKVLNRRWLEEFGGLLGNRIQDMVGVDGITEKDLTPYFYPSDEEIER